MKWHHLQLLPRTVSPLTVVAEMEVSPQEETMANPQGMKVFAVERHVLPEDFMSLCAPCGVESSLFVFAPNRAFMSCPLQWQVPGETVFQVCVFLS